MLDTPQAHHHTGTSGPDRHPGGDPAQAGPSPGPDEARPPPPAGPLAELPGDYDPADFRLRLQAWVQQHGAGLPPPSGADQDAAAELADPSVVRRLSEDLRSAITAALSMGLAHSAEMLLTALSRHPLVRLAAVSHPFVVGTLLERWLKRLLDVHDPDPAGYTGPRYQEKIAAALLNWNHVQPTLDALLHSPLARMLKAGVSALISGLRDVTEREHTRRLLAALPPDAPPGIRKMTELESLFVNCLMCGMRNVMVDLPRQVVKTGGAQALPAARGAAENLLRRAILGSQVPGSLPATAIASQAAFADVVRAGADGWEPPPDLAGLGLAYQANDLFS